MAEQVDVQETVEQPKEIQLATHIPSNLYSAGSEIEGGIGRSFLIFGDPGAGKTCLLKTLIGWEHGKGYVNEPYYNPSEILVIDVESGESVLQREGRRCVSVYRVEEDNQSLSNFKNLIQWLHEDDHPFKCIVVDNMSELEKYFLIALTKSKSLDVPRQKEWGDDAFYMRKYIRDIRKLQYKGITIIFNFWAMNVPIEGMDHQMTVPMVMRSTTMEYIGLVEHCAYLGVGKNGIRFLQFESNERIKCKHRDPGDGPRMLEKFEEADLGMIMNKLDQGGSNDVHKAATVVEDIFEEGEDATGGENDTGA